MEQRYNNFIKASATAVTTKQPALSGEQAKKIYLEEIKDAENSTLAFVNTVPKSSSTRQLQNKLENFSITDLFMCVQNNDVKMMKDILDSCPSIIDTTDEYGWSLLMIACQANSVDSVKELLKRGADVSVRDRGGHSATNLIIKNKNLELANLLITHRQNNPEQNFRNESSKTTTTKVQKINTKLEKSYKCEICDNKVFSDKVEHLASTVHNMSASKDKKIPTHYAIPQTNRGYQLMLKVGWDRECGLGRDGSGKKYPIKAIQKKDRKGLGHDKKNKKESSKQILKDNRWVPRDSRNYKTMEINFRREFY